MELGTSAVAAMAGVSSRQVRFAITSGLLQPLRMVGSSIVLDDIAVRAWLRAPGRGRPFSPRIREAVLDLLTFRHTEALVGSELARLRRRLAAASVGQVAHALGGLGGTWARYTALDAIDNEHLGPSLDLELGLVRGTREIAYVRVNDLDEFERRHRVRLDAFGGLGAIERRPDDREGRTLLDIYLLGTERESAAAAVLIEERLHALA